MSVEQQFLEWLKAHHSGKENAINAVNMRQWGTRRQIRHFVHSLRLLGHPICSGYEGYYYAVKLSEVSDTLDFLESMQDDLSKIIVDLRSYREQLASTFGG